MTVVRPGMWNKELTMIERRSVSAGGRFDFLAVVRDAARDESGATAVEYGLIALGIAVAIIVGIDAVGGSLNASLVNIAGIAF